MDDEIMEKNQQHWKKLDEDIKEVEKQLKQLEKNVSNGDLSSTSGVAFVCFDKQDCNNYILEQSKTSPLMALFIKVISLVTS